MPAAHRPDEPQQTILDAYRSGSLSIIAVPGAGKTTLLINLTCKLIQEGNAPEGILLVTFTEKAAAELSLRLEETLLHRNIITPTKEHPTVLTLHSLGAQILSDRTNPLDLGLSYQPRMWDEALQLHHVIDLCRTLSGTFRGIGLPDMPPEVDPGAWKNVAWAVISAIAHARELGLSPTDTAALAKRTSDQQDRNLLTDLALLYESYEDRKKKACAIDYTDQVLLALHLLDDPGVSRRWQKCFNYVIEDDSQDSSFAQYKLINKLSELVGNLILVGDPLQSIYAWRDAFTEGIHIHHQRADQHHFLTRNYRSSHRVVDFANYWKKHWQDDKVTIEPRRDAQPGVLERTFFPSQNVEAEAIAHCIHQILLNDPTTTIAVLGRSRTQLDVIATVLARSQIYFRNPDTGSFYQSERIRHWYDILALMDALLHKPFTELDAEQAVRHLQQLVSRQQDQVQLITTTFQPLRTCRTPGAFLDELARLASEGAPFSGVVLDIYAKVQRGLHQLLGTHGTLSERLLHILSAFVSIDDLQGRNYLTKLISSGQRLADENESLTLTEWLEWLLIQINFSRVAAPEPLDVAQPGVVVLSTIHGAKGLEWDNVFVPGLRGPETPWRSLSTDLQVAIDYTFDWGEKSNAWSRQYNTSAAESCRLAYVAFTRARNSLYLSTYRRSKFWDVIQNWKE